MGRWLLLLLVRELRRLIVPLAGLLLALLAGLAVPARAQPSDCWIGNPDASRTYYDCVTGAVLCTCPSWDTLCQTVACAPPGGGGGTGASSGGNLTVTCFPSPSSIFADGQQTSTFTVTVYDDNGIAVTGATVSVKPGLYTISRGSNVTNGLGQVTWIFGTVHTGANIIPINASLAARGLSGSTNTTVTSTDPHPSSVSVISPPYGSVLNCVLPVLMGQQNDMEEKWSWNSSRVGAGPEPYAVNLTLQGRNGTCDTGGYSIAGLYGSSNQGGQAFAADNICCWNVGADAVVCQLYIGQYKTQPDGSAQYIYGGPIAAAPSRSFTVARPAQ
jgi:hypothetical protein